MVVCLKVTIEGDGSFMQAQYKTVLSAITPTKLQQKKHIKQMNKEEINFLLGKIDNIEIENLKLSKHLLDKNLTFNFIEIKKVLKLKEFEIVEYNETEFFNDGSIDKRVLLKSKEVYPVKFCDEIHGISFITKSKMCFVVSLKLNKIVTLYWRTENTKEKLNWNRYYEDLQIIK
jgi:hypothetical protein